MIGGANRGELAMTAFIFGRIYGAAFLASLGKHLDRWLADRRSRER